MFHIVTQSETNIKAQKEVPTEEESNDPSETATTSPRKERVIHTRVPAVLELELKRFAENLRIPVSNLIRTILEDAVSVADIASETVENRLRFAVQHLEFERERLRKRVQLDPLAHVFAFQPVTLAKPAECAKCKCKLLSGEKAHFGLSDPDVQRTGNNKLFVCEKCLPKGM